MITTEERIYEIIKTSPVFCALSGADIHRITDAYAQIITAGKGEKLCRADECAPALFIMLSGSANVYRVNTERVLMSVLHTGGMFGMASMFSDTNEQPPTEITARSQCEMLVISEDTLKEIFAEYPAAAVGYINLLSEKIRYLNKKIDTYTSPSVNKKAALFILSEMNEDNEMTLDSGGMAAAAKKLNASRASVYRAFDHLESINAVKRNGKIITVLDIDKLNNIQE